MKKYLPYGVALAILGLAATPLISQTQTTANSSSSTYIQASKIVGTKVKTQSGEEVGVVKDVVLDRSNGCMAYTVLSAGGGGSRVTGQSKLVAVPWSVYSVSPDASYLTTTIERDRIYNGPVFEYSRIGDPSFTSTVYSTFGVAGGVGVSNATSTTTGVNTQTQTNAQLNATNNPNNPNNPPPPAAGPTNNPSPGASASPSASASATAEPSASPSKVSRGAKGGMSPASSPRQRGDEMTKGTGTSDESGSESTGSSKSSKSSKKGSSAEKSSDTESSGEATEKPSSSKHSSHKKGTTSGEGTSTTEPSPGEQE